MISLVIKYMLRQFLKKSLCIRWETRMNSLAVKNEVRVDLKFNKSKEYM